MSTAGNISISVAALGLSASVVSPAVRGAAHLNPSSLGAAFSLPSPTITAESSGISFGLMMGGEI